MGKENVLRPARGMKIAAALAASGLTFAVAACGSAPSTPTTSPTSNKTYTGCMVTDQGGLDDKSFNASAWKGMQAAEATSVPGVKITVKNVASTTAADYEPNLTGFVNQKCDFILAVGGLMGDATTKIAKANPNQQFGIVDSRPGAPNVYPMQFDTAQAAFLAGYLAAGYSKTGKVGTYGGLKIPPVTIFMDGFADGVAVLQHQAQGKNVQVLGWDKAKQDGSFANDFASPPKGKAISDTLFAQGADVIMPVAGGTGLGTAADAAAGKFAAIWVDVDGCQSTTYCKGLLTTVVRRTSRTRCATPCSRAPRARASPRPPASSAR